jgi:hypothetical protein
MKEFFLFFALLLVFSTSCDLLEKSESIKKEKVSGVIQKGPFVSGTSVFMYELNPQLGQSGKSFTTSILDDSGMFEFNTIELMSNYVELISMGFYFNEVTGQISTSPISLTSISDIEDRTSINVNVITHLEKRRIEKLLREGKSFSEAKIQSRNEVLSVFSITFTSDVTSEDFDISKNSEEGAILLSISILVQGNRTVGQVTELLSKIQNDIFDNGKIDDLSIHQSLYESFQRVDQKKIRQNLNTRLIQLNNSSQIPNFEKYLDIFERSFPINPNFVLGENGITCKCPNAKPGELGVVGGKIFEAVDNELLRKRIRDVDEKGVSNFDLTKLCTSLVSDMKELFPFATPVGKIENWDVGNVKNMNNMFYRNKLFNQPIGIWDVSKVVEMNGMFQSSLFNQDISNWCVKNILTEPSFFSIDSPLAIGFKPKWGSCPY